MLMLISTIIFVPLVIALSVNAGIKSERDLSGQTMGLIAGILGIVYVIVASIALLMLNYQYNRDFDSDWRLGVKASTIKLKHEYVKKFYENITSHRKEFRDSSALLMPTPDNSVDSNLVTLKSLVERLEKVQDMDENSLAYQTAMQQITGQEQDEAHAMLGVFEDSYKLQNSILFSWLGFIICSITFMFAAFGFTIANE